MKSDIEPSSVNKRGLYIIGLDPSISSFGISVLNSNGRLISTSIITTSPDEFKTRMERLDYIISELNKVFKLYSNKFVVIEHYAFGKFSSAYSLAELGGVLRYKLYKEDIPFIEIAPTTLKKYFTGRGDAKKEDIKAWIYKRYQYEFMDKTNDEADAFVCACYGFSVLYPDKTVKKAK